MWLIELCLYGDRAVHRATDTVDACGGAGHAGSAGCSLPETPESGILRAREVAFPPGRTVAGAGERAIPNGGFRVRSCQSSGAGHGSMVTDQTTGGQQRTINICW